MSERHCPEHRGDRSCAFIRSVGHPVESLRVTESIKKWMCPRRSVPGRNRVSPDRNRGTLFIYVKLSPSGGQSGGLWLGVHAHTAVVECRCVLAARPCDRLISARCCADETT